jgi:hypothetical protein
MLDRVTGMQIFVRVANLGGFSAAARSLALQLPICFEVRALSGSLVSSTPE